MFLQITIDLLIKGVVIGVVVSAPLGPVGVLCVQRSLNKGRWYGFVTGLGAALSDIVYAILTGYGMSFLFEFIHNNILYLQLIGSFMLLLFGVYTFRSNPVHSIRPSSSNKGSYLHNFFTAFALTFSNPLIIFLFIGLFARFAFVLPGLPLYETAIGYLSIIGGAVVWWFSITFFVSKVRNRFNMKEIWMINRVIGGVVIIASVIGFVSTLLGASFSF
jgi:threonine/homoserine/homoserine lactone efflux protein